MSADKEMQKSQLKELIAKGKEQGYLTYAEVNDHLPESPRLNRSKTSSRWSTIWASRCTSALRKPDDLLLEETPDASDDEVAAEEAAAVLDLPWKTNPAAPPIPSACTCARWAPWSC
jgi:RNA polymerase primary sigma factor